MSRFFAPKENIKGNLIYIDGQEARHILNVMRLRENDKVVVFDGTGKEYGGFIKHVRPKSLTVEIITTRAPKIETLPEITLAQAVLKKEKMDYVIEKATELGVHMIIPLITERTIVRFKNDKAVSKLTRWKKIAVAAAKQCGRRDVPQIEDVQKFYNVIDSVNKFDLALMGCLSEDAIAFKKAIPDFKSGKIIIFIGPEGDFTPDEILMARDTSCKLISLGRRTLKSDTAGLFILSVLNYEFSR